MIELKFVNPQITDDYENPGVNIIECSDTSMNDILAWYGAYYAGDDYEVYRNGKLVSIDQNGEFEPMIIEASQNVKQIIFDSKEPNK